MVSTWMSVIDSYIQVKKSVSKQSDSDLLIFFEWIIWQCPVVNTSMLHVIVNGEAGVPSMRVITLNLSHNIIVHVYIQIQFRFFFYYFKFVVIKRTSTAVWLYFWYMKGNAEVGKCSLDMCMLRRWYLDVQHCMLGYMWFRIEEEMLRNMETFILSWIGNQSGVNSTECV